MEKKYFTCMIGPMQKDAISDEFGYFMDNVREYIIPVETEMSNYITEERFDLLRQVNLIDTPTLKRMLQK